MLVVELEGVVGEEVGVEAVVVEATEERKVVEVVAAEAEALDVDDAEDEDELEIVEVEVAVVEASIPTVTVVYSIAVTICVTIATPGSVVVVGKIAKFI